MKTAIIGAGLAGSECAWQLAKNGVKCTLFEMRPKRFTPAHTGENAAELVCSNSFRSEDKNTAIGLLKLEMQELGSLIMETALTCRVPAGKALAVDRELFSTAVTQKITSHPDISFKREEITSFSSAQLAEFDRIVLAAGPLITDELANELQQIVGQKELAFYDAVAPIVVTESIDMKKAYWGERYNPTGHDYLNCPLQEREYRNFVEALRNAKYVMPRAFENEKHFEGCLPIETMAERGEMTLAFGPLKPVGLPDPRTGKDPFAVVQLRAEKRDKSTLNMVGFQTKLKYGEQERIFRMIPGLENVRFERLGSIHRNTFINAPKTLSPTLELKNRRGLYLVGQITGVEGYLESAASGLWLGLYLSGKIPDLPPQETALGALLSHLQTPSSNFQPSNVIFGLMPPLEQKARKQERKLLYAERARQVWNDWLKELKK